MVPRSLRAIACVMLSLFVLVPATVIGVARAAATSDSTTRVGTVDDELVDVLQRLELLTTWVELSQTAPELSVMRVSADERYDADRQTFLDEVRRVGSAHSESLASLAALEWLEAEHAVLDSHVGDVRSVLLTQSRIEPIAHVSSTVELAAIDELAAPSPARFDRDAIGAARYQLGRIRQAVRDEIQALSRQRTMANKALHQSLVRVGQWHRELRHIDTLIQTERAANAEQWRTADLERERLIASMADLHEQRLAAVSTVEGLPIVTLDAYVRAASDLEPGCPVDWALIAGIGRVESFHGTIDDSAVGVTGRVTTAIFGPLLDGGATAREEAAAALAAEEEEARLVAEAEAAAIAEEEARAAHFNSLVWGDSSQDDVSDEEVPGGDSDAVAARSDEGATVDEDELDTDVEDSKDDEPQGNGFAVIEDTDGGSLDGNDRWDRAVGPMQFIPGTWALWSTDGNNDGVSDPQNLYDAAAAAGDYLCYLARRNGNDPRTFILGYNASSSYANSVVNHADRMRQPLPQVGDAS